MTHTSDAIQKQISYSATDWAVTDGEQAKTVNLIRSDTNLSATIEDLQKAGMLDELLVRVMSAQYRNKLLQTLAGRLNPKAKLLIQESILKRVTYQTPNPYLPLSWIELYKISQQLQTRLSLFGITPTSGSASTGPIAGVVSSSPQDPYTGSGATGINPTTLSSIPVTDKLLLLADNQSTQNNYKGPTFSGRLHPFLSRLSQSQFIQQVRSVLQMRISSVFPYSYPGSLPSRAVVMKAAAKQYNLKPELVASIILVEQWDQSKNEDAADYQGAVSVMSKNTSIGLGQVVVTTAKRHDLFSELLDSGVRAALQHKQIAALLASDEFNIFAVAKFLRHVADQGSTKNINNLPATQAEYPNINMADYSRHSKYWSNDNVKAIASEYTSRQWDDSLVVYWSDLMDLAYKQIQNSHIF